MSKERGQTKKTSPRLEFACGAGICLVLLFTVAAVLEEVGAMPLPIWARTIAFNAVIVTGSVFIVSLATSIIREIGKDHPVINTLIVFVVLVGGLLVMLFLGISFEKGVTDPWWPGG